MNPILIIITVIALISIIALIIMTIIIKRIQREATNEPKDEKLPYIIVNRLLTDKELKFYNSLKPITDELGYSIMCKVRLADLAYTPSGIQHYMKWFNAVRSKHIDFVVCSSDTSPIFAIEIDDKTHDKESRQQRDEFVNRIFENKSVKLLRYRTWTIEQLKQDFSANEKLVTEN